jgi:hypothetical protein
MDEAIIHYVKKTYNLLIGERTAEAIKIEIGSAFPLDEPMTMEIKGRHLIEGVPKTIEISDEEIRQALAETVNVIVDAVRVALERTPPELSADIVDRGIMLTSGGSLLKNLDKRLREETGLPIAMAEDPLSSVVLGAGKDAVGFRPPQEDFDRLMACAWRIPKFIGISGISRSCYDCAMRDLAVLFLHVLATVARPAGPGGARALVAESLLVKQQLLILNRSRKRSPNLRLADCIVSR